MELWIVGKTIDHAKCAWELMGVFDSEKKAVKECIEDDFFIAPTPLNRLHQDSDKWNGQYYPLLETKEEAAARFKETAKS